MNVKYGKRCMLNIADSNGGHVMQIGLIHVHISQTRRRGKCVTCNSTNKTITKLLQKYYKNSIMGFERHKRGDKTMAEN